MGRDAKDEGGRRVLGGCKKMMNLDRFIHYDVGEKATGDDAITLRVGLFGTGVVQVVAAIFALFTLCRYKHFSECSCSSHHTGHAEVHVIAMHAGVSIPLLV